MNQKIWNPESGKYVKIDGATGRKVIKERETKKRIKKNREQYNLKYKKFFMNNNLLDHCIELVRRVSVGGFYYCSPLMGDYCAKCRDKKYDDRKHYIGKGEVVSVNRIGIPNFIKDINYKLSIPEKIDFSIFEKKCKLPNELIRLVKSFFEDSDLKTFLGEYLNDSRHQSFEPLYEITDISFKPNPSKKYVYNLFPTGEQYDDSRFS